MRIFDQSPQNQKHTLKNLSSTFLIIFHFLIIGRGASSYDLRIIGQEVSDRTKQHIGIELAKITPTADIEVSYLNLSNTNKYIIVFDVTTNSSKRPYMYDHKAFMRSQSTTCNMPREYLNNLILINATGKFAWENRVQEGLTVDDLDIEEIMNTVNEGILNGRIPENYSTKDPLIALQRLELLDNGKLINAAEVLFGKESSSIFPQCTLKLARFRGINKSEFIDNKQFRGNIFRLLNGVRP